MRLHKWRTGRRILSVALCLGLLASLGLVAEAFDSRNGRRRGPRDDDAVRAAKRLVHDGQQIFRYDTFGDEVFWGDTLRLHEALATVSPATALAVGLKVDSKAMGSRLRGKLVAGRLDLDDPAVTAKLLRRDAIIGVRGFFDRRGNLESVGIQCALCHSIVDDWLAPGVGRRLDGWANRDLDVGTIISLAPDLSVFSDLLGVDEATVRTVLQSWGPGKFDASLLLDGKAFRPDGGPAAVLIPPAFGLAGINLHTWTGWGSISHWNGLVAVLEMGGQGTFIDPRLNDAERFPIATAQGAFEVRSHPDLVTSKLPALQMYQLALLPPEPPRGSFDRRAARRGRALFDGKANCASCHVRPLFTEPGHNLHSPEELGIDSFQANRSPTGAYRTSPLAGLWTHGKGGYFHDGRFATLQEVVDHYDSWFTLGLDDDEKDDLIEYLRSI